MFCPINFSEIRPPCQEGNKTEKTIQKNYKNNCDNKILESQEIKKSSSPKQSYNNENDEGEMNNLNNSYENSFFLEHRLHSHEEIKIEKYSFQKELKNEFELKFDQNKIIHDDADITIPQKSYYIESSLLLIYKLLVKMADIQVSENKIEEIQDIMKFTKEKSTHQEQGKIKKLFITKKIIFLRRYDSFSK